MSTFDDYLFSTPKPQHVKSEEHASTPEHAAGAVGAPTAQGLLHLQRLAGNAAVVQRMRTDDDAETVNRARAGGGEPLDVATRVQMEQSIGSDFSDVRVHTGSEADNSARSLGAHAYTVGSDVVFSQGRYDPSSHEGQRTLAHELTHVVQQRSGPVDGTETGTGVRVSDPADRFEQAAEASADRVMSGATSDVGLASPMGAASVQRQEDQEQLQGNSAQRQDAGQEEEEIQGMFVQRQDAGQDEEEIQGLFVQREQEPEEEMAT
jgi:hypothetical protein